MAWSFHMALNLLKISSANFPYFPDAKIFVHWPGSRVELEFDSNSSANLGTSQQWLIPPVPGGSLSDATNSIRFRFGATGEIYYLRDRGTDSVPAPRSRLSTTVEVVVAIGDEVDLGALDLVLTYQKNATPHVVFSLQ